VPFRAILLACVLVLLVGGCRTGDEPTLGAKLVEPQASKLRKVAAGYAAQWTADGRIVYIGARDGDVWGVRPNGNGSRRLVRLRRDHGLDVSPDRARMLLLRGDRNLVAKTDGGRTRPVTPVSQVGAARWNDDGSQITFERRHGTRRSIWAVPARGGRPKRLFGEFGGSVLAWAPHGGIIVHAFQEGKGGSFRATLLIHDGAEPVELPDLVEARFLRDGTVEGIESQGSFVVLDAAGTILRRIDVGALPDRSPDGRIVYEHEGHVWIADSDWSEPVRIAAGACSRPAFSPDGSRVVCSLVETTQRHGKRRPDRRRYVAVVGVPAELR
jgi:dipeptidyl aminopeptidase/acylaminoacyl peptidase